MAIQVTLDHLKVLAHQSKSELAREGLSLGHKQCLDLQARIHGFPNYEAAKAAIEGEKASAAGSATLGNSEGLYGPVLEPTPEIVAHAANPVRWDELPLVMGKGLRMALTKESPLSQGAREFFGMIEEDESDDIDVASEMVAHLMMGWQYPMGTAYPESTESFFTCRQVMKWPESQGRVAELARLGGAWPLIASNWEALCKMAEEDFEEPVGMVTLGSVRALAAKSFGEDAVLPKEQRSRMMDAIAKRYPETCWDGWAIWRIAGQWEEMVRGEQVCAPRDWMFVSLVKFGEPQRLVLVPWKWPH